MFVILLEVREVNKIMKKESNMTPTLASLFSGCGGLDLGFKWAGLSAIWANEILSDAVSTYKKHIDENITLGDINDYITSIPKVDVLIGGPPCQSFSLVGKRLSEDPRGMLVFAYLEAVATVKPKVFVMENVPGLLASKIEGEYLYKYLMEEYTKIGYTVNLYKLDATDFYVPQRRKRVFMIGVKKTLKHVPIVQGDEFIYNCLGFKNEIYPVTSLQALDDLPSPVAKNSDPIAYQKPPHSNYSKIMRITNSEKVTLQEMPTMSELDKLFVKYIPPGGNYMNIPDEISTKRILNFKQTGGRTTTYGRLDPNKPAYTINTYFNRPNVGTNYHYADERLITAREALRLQSFPDWFTPNFTSQRNLHIQIGNAVPPLLGLGIAETVKKILKYEKTIDFNIFN